MRRYRTFPSTTTAAISGRWRPCCAARLPGRAHHRRPLRPGRLRGILRRHRPGPGHPRQPHPLHRRSRRHRRHRAYAGQPLTHLLPLLVDEADRQATWDYASDLLARAGACADVRRGHRPRRLRPRLPRPRAAPRRPRRRHPPPRLLRPGRRRRPSLAVLHATRPTTAPGPARRSRGPRLLHGPRRRLRPGSPGGLVLRTTQPRATPPTTRPRLVA